MVLVGLLGARVYYVLFYLSYYLAHPLEIVAIWKGGLAIHGGILASLIFIVYYCKKKKINIYKMLDIIVVGLVIGQAIGRWGNYINIEAYGYETNLPIKMEIIEKGIIKYVHPTFLYESICTFIIFIVLSKLSKNRKFTGEITYLYIICYSFIRFIIEGLRTDSLMLFNWRISQILSLAFFIVFSIILIYKKNKYKHMSNFVEKDR